MADGEWKKAVGEFCAAFGFRLEYVERIQFGEEFRGVVVKSGRSTVAYKDASARWTRGETPLEAELRLDKYEASDDAVAKAVEGACREIMETLSGAELIVRSSDKDRKTPWGYTKVRLIRHILLPEFGSVEELKLKLAVAEK